MITQLLTIGLRVYSGEFTSAWSIYPMTEKLTFVNGYLIQPVSILMPQKCLVVQRVRERKTGRKERKKERERERGSSDGAKVF